MTKMKERPGVGTRPEARPEVRPGATGSAGERPGLRSQEARASAAVIG